MSSEIVDPFTHQPEELTPLNRFERLLDLMKSYADSESSWHTLPQIKVTISRKESADIYTQFFLFIPEPLPEYDKTLYSPSITMELGYREPEPETGRLIGEAEQTYVRKSYFEEGSPYYQKNSRQGEEDLEKIETMFYAYKNTKESLKLTG